MLIIVGAFMLFMIIFGMKKGLVRMLLSFGSIFVVLILVNFLNPIAKQTLSASPVYDGVYSRVDEYVAKNIKDLRGTLEVEFVTDSRYPEYY